MEADVLRFGPEGGENDLVLVCPHDGDTESFAENVEVLGALKTDEDRKAFKNYLDLERDAGSQALSMSIAHAVREELGMGSRVVVVSATVPRGVKDANRNLDRPGAADAQIFERELPPDVQDALWRGYMSATMKTFAEIGRLSWQGVVLDVHTMASHSPDRMQSYVNQNVTARPGNLAQYVRAWTDPQYLERTARPIDIPTRTPAPDDKVIAHRDLSQEILGELRASHFNAAVDDPYRIPLNSMTRTWMQEGARRAAAVDVPKHLLTGHSPNSKKYNPIRPEINLDEVGKVAAPIARALVRVIQTPR